MADHKITVHSEDGIWLLGAVDDYPFEAKVCDEASGFGIDCGRVIKLHIRGKQASGEIAAYERGWDRFPKGAHKGLARAVIRFCESLPEQEIFIWHLAVTSLGRPIGRGYSHVGGWAMHPPFSFCS